MPEPPAEFAGGSLGSFGKRRGYAARAESVELTVERRQDRPYGSTSERLRAPRRAIHALLFSKSFSVVQFIGKDWTVADEDDRANELTGFEIAAINLVNCRRKIYYIRPARPV
jgi:hypothetical protein